MIDPNGAFVLSRFVFDVAALFLWGASAYLIALVPADLRQSLWAGLAPARRMALVCCVIATLVQLPLRSAMIGDGWADAVNREMLSLVALQTTAGTAWLCQAGSVVALWLSLRIPAPRRLAATAIIAACMLASLTTSGHAAMHTGWLGVLHRVNDWLHLLAGGAWFGALVPVAMTLPRLRAAAWRRQATLALMRFSTAGHIAVTLVIVSGIANTSLILGEPPIAWTNTYQAMLAIKIGLVTLMVTLAILNRYVLVPSMRSGGSTQRPLIVATLSELVLALLIIGLVAWFGMLAPG